jgi:small subunit ribosomal protein S17
MSDITNNEETVEVTEGAAAPTAAAEVDTVVETPSVTETPAVAATSVAETTPGAPTPVVERTGPVIQVPVVKGTRAVVEDGSDSRNNPRKVREGIVISDKMDMTLVVAVNERVRHPRYGKTVQRTKKLYVHDEKNDAKIGDRVRVQETRPLSKLKRWRLTEVVERAR